MFNIKVKGIEQKEEEKPIWNKVMDKLGIEVWVK